mmetsp:Transcript_9736/g.26443  ORF Transcript_9736/g.26443 Transcript_9736/m.26443 type:complete len:203 (+) Transcript_9736:410-1018(+)
MGKHAVMYLSSDLLLELEPCPGEQVKQYDENALHRHIGPRRSVSEQAHAEVIRDGRRAQIRDVSVPSKEVVHLRAECPERWACVDQPPPPPPSRVDRNQEPREKQADDSVDGDGRVCNVEPVYASWNDTANRIAHQNPRNIRDEEGHPPADKRACQLERKPHDGVYRQRGGHGDDNLLEEQIVQVRNAPVQPIIPLTEVERL